jgi:hypothetical protein
LPRQQCVERRRGSFPGSGPLVAGKVCRVIDAEIQPLGRPFLSISICCERFGGVDKP